MTDINDAGIAPDEKTAEELLAELTAKEEELSKLKEKDLNFSNLRKQKEDAEEQNKALQATINEKVDAVKKEILESTVKNYYTDQLVELAGDDEELKKKIEFQYERIKDTASSKEEVSKKLRDAWTLATVDDVSAVSSNVFSSSGVSGVKPKAKAAFSSDEKAILSKLAQAGGITLDEDDLK